MNLKKLLTGNSRLSEIVRFALVGGLATVLQYGFYIIFVHAVGVPAVPSTMISYALSFIVNYILSSYFTFHTLSHLVNMGLQTGLVAIFKEIVGKTLALLPAMALCIPVNYFLVRFAFTSKIFHGSPKKESGKSPSEGCSLLQDEQQALDDTAK